MARKSFVHRMAEVSTPAVNTAPVLVEKVTAAQKVACPYCGSRQNLVERTIGNIRYRRCAVGCGRSFSTSEHVRNS